MDEFKKVLLMHGYELRSHAGNGTTAMCYIVFSQIYKTDFVCKIIQSDQITKSKSIFTNELNALVNLDHKNVIRCYDNFVWNDVYFLILEYCPNGSLQQLLENNSDVVKKNALMYAKQIINGLEYCHKKGITHLDIKPHNILIDNYNRLKLSDFGLSYMSKPECNESVNLTKRGSYAYMAPEVVKSNDTPYNPFKADVWSLGITIYRIAKGEAHMIYNNLSKQWREIYVDSFEFKILGPIIQNCLTFCPEERPSISDIKDLLYKREENCKCRPRFIGCGNKSIVCPPRPLKRPHSIIIPHSIVFQHHI